MPWGTFLNLFVAEPDDYWKSLGEKFQRQHWAVMLIASLHLLWEKFQNSAPPQLHLWSQATISRCVDKPLLMQFSLSPNHPENPWVPSGREKKQATEGRAMYRTIFRNSDLRTVVCKPASKHKVQIPACWSLTHHGLSGGVISVVTSDYDLTLRMIIIFHEWELIHTKQLITQRGTHAIRNDTHITVAERGRNSKSPNTSLKETVP